MCLFLDGGGQIGISPYSMTAKAKRFYKAAFVKGEIHCFK